MDIGKTIFYPVMAVLLLLTTTFASAQKRIAPKIDLPVINCVDANLPITFSWIDFDDPGEETPVVVQKKIQKIILDFYFESTGRDSANVSKAKDYYFNTLRVPLSNTQLFIVILKTPMSYSHCKLFLYDSAANTVSKKVVDYNTWAMYSISTEDNKMNRSTPYKEEHLNSDDIILKRRSNLLLKRLKTNGTNGELEEITYCPNGVSLDSVSFKSHKLDW